MICPYCEEEVPLNEYSNHYNVCPKRRQKIPLTEASAFWKREKGTLGKVRFTDVLPYSVQIEDRDGEWLDIELHGQDLVFTTGGKPLPTPIINAVRFRKLLSKFYDKCKIEETPFFLEWDDVIQLVNAFSYANKQYASLSGWTRTSYRVALQEFIHSLNRKNLIPDEWVEPLLKHGYAVKS